MRIIPCVVCALLAWSSLGAGPVWHEPTNYTGEAIERAIAAAHKDIRGRVFLPGGTYRITKTIVLTGTGLILIEGASQGTVYKEWNHASSVILEWHGPKDQPMIRMNAFSVHFRNLMLDGRNVASHGIHLVNQPQSGSGMGRLEDVTLANFTDSCFQAGVKEGDGNCSDMFFDRVFFLRAPVGFKSVTAQSVNHQFIGCGFWLLECALDVQQGGALTMIGQGASSCDVLLRVRAGGPNPGAINLSSLKIENGGYKRRHMSLVDARALTPAGAPDVLWGCQINIQGLWMAGGKPADVADDVPIPLFQLGAGAQLNLSGGAFRPAGNQEQWPFAVLTGTPPGQPILRAPNSIWMGKVNDSTFQLNGPGLIDVVPSDIPGTRTQTPLRIEKLR